MFKILKETEKAVAVENEEYASAKEDAKYDIKELDGRQIEVLRKGTSLVWLPKSQIKIENGFVVSMPTWLAKKTGLLTVVEINGKKYAREILVENKKMLAELGFTAEQVLEMKESSL